GFEQMVNPAPVVGVNASQSIVTSVQPLGELTSIRMQLAKANITVNINQGPLGVCGHSASYVAQGTIEAGLDLTRLGPEDISYNALTDTYTITLPAPQLLSCHVDFMDQYAGSLTLCNVDWDTARQLGQHVALLDFRDDTLESGILGQAEQQARLVVGNFVRSLTGSNVEIVFAQTDPATLTDAWPSSCQPEPPGDWVYDVTTNSWTTR
ncbi:MAG: DUF4230 domain-containing protein, partial [Anaerolineae bacterium]|nr:DUF4230 domain-containing protein [Anaerolineae bacterium]